MDFAPIYDHPEHRQTVAQWLYEEFCVTDRASVTLSDTNEKLKSRTNAFPYTYLALEDGEAVGTVTLYENDLKGSPFTPWLGSLVVAKPFRGRGIARALIAFVCGKARGMGYSELYLRTEHTAEYYEALGWEFVEKTVDPVYNLQTAVYRLDLEELQ